MLRATVNPLHIPSLGRDCMSQYIQIICNQEVSSTISKHFVIYLYIYIFTIVLLISHKVVAILISHYLFDLISNQLPSTSSPLSHAAFDLFSPLLAWNLLTNGENRYFALSMPCFNFKGWAKLVVQVFRVIIWYTSGLAAKQFHQPSLKCKDTGLLGVWQFSSFPANTRTFSPVWM